MHRGYIKIWRKIEEWEWWDDIKTSRLFLVLILMANVKDKNWHGQDIPRGSLVSSLDKIAKKSGLSVQSVRTSLKKLKSTHELTYESTRNFTLIKINKYNDYHEANTLPNNQLTNNQQTINKRLTTTKEVKNEKNEKNKSMRGTALRFVPPTLTEVHEYCESRDNGIEAQRFIDFYEARGWFIGKNKMKKWQAAIRTWEGRDQKESNFSPRQRKTNVTII